MQNRINDKEVRGLYQRIGKRGVTFNYARWKGGRIVRASLGPVALHTLDAARRWATNLNLQGAGLTPSWSLGEVVTHATAKAAKKGNRQPSYLGYVVGLHAPDWLGLPLSSITKAMVNERHDRIVGQRAAARWVTVLNTLYHFAENNLGWEGRNPAKGVEVAPGKARQVVWTPDQVSAFLSAAEVEDEYWHSYFTLVAVTGMRRGNVAAMEWSEVVGDTWTIPASKFKNKEEHVVHLVPAALTALARRPRDGQYVFPGTNEHLRDPYPAFQRICKRAGVTGVTIHDLRRTLGSRLAARVPLPVVAAILGHKTVNTTMKHYAVVSREAVESALNGLTT